MKLGVKYAIIVLVVYGSCLVVYINYKASASLPLSSTDSDVDVHANSARQLQQVSYGDVISTMCTRVQLLSYYNWTLFSKYVFILQLEKILINNQAIDVQT